MKRRFWSLSALFFVVVLMIACAPQGGQSPTAEDPVGTLPPPEIQNSTATSAPEATATASPEPTVTSTATQVEILQTETAAPTVTEATQDPSDEDIRISETDGMVQIYIPAGEFIMGTDDPNAKTTVEGGRAYPENPAHTVTLDGYWFDQYEVSTSQYALCVEAGVCDPPYRPDSETRPAYYGNPEYADYPVIWVSWYMATEYCEWAGRRLPTEAEWEKAARGTDGRMFPWGNDPIDGERANFCDTNCPRTIANHNYDDGFADTAPVDSFPLGASPYGVMNMSGNVWEWTSTIIEPYPYDATDGREDPERYAERVWRGGPWSNGTWWQRSSIRYRSIPFYWYVNLGFRCAASE
jgi:serine/threonine-protein kinase